MAVRRTGQSNHLRARPQQKNEGSDGRGCHRGASGQVRVHGSEAAPRKRNALQGRCSVEPRREELRHWLREEW